MKIDKDLLSIQNVRDCINVAYEAQKKLAQLSQTQIDKIVAAIAKAGFENAAELGKLAHEETGFGKAADKEIKNKFASKAVYESIKNMHTIGIINDDSLSSITEIATPVGVIAGIIPSTNPTSTVIYKAMISIKAGNALVISPHPGALQSILKTFAIINEAALKAGMPEGCLQCINVPTMQGTDILMKHDKVNLILATGGSAMVKAAYSSGNPAIGVGPGNGPAFIEKSADIKDAVAKIVASKTFDNGVICASEQSIIVEKVIRDEVMDELKRQGCYFLNEQQKEQLSKFILRPNLTMNPAIVGKDIYQIAKLANIRIPDGYKILIAPETKVGIETPYSQEKLCPILAFYVEDSWEKACDRCIEILRFEGAGHTMVIHSKDEAIIKEFALQKPVNRILVNTYGALGGIGASTDLAPALTLGCGAVGKSSTSDNVSPRHLINIKRVARNVTNVANIQEDFKKSFNPNNSNDESNNEDLLISAIVEQVMAKIK